MRFLIVSISALLLSGCAINGSQSTDKQSNVPFPFPIESSHEVITPSKNVHVGHLYFAGPGKKSGFVDKTGQVFSRLCYENYAQTEALRAIASHVEDSSDEEEREISGPVGPGFWLNFLGLVSVDYGTTASAKVRNTHLLKLSDEGRAIVGESLDLSDLDEEAPKGEAASCREEILKRKADGQRVVLVLGAERAERLSSEIQTGMGTIIGIPNSIGGSAGPVAGGARTGTQGGLAPAQKQQTRSTKTNVVFSVDLEDL